MRALNRVQAKKSIIAAHIYGLKYIVAIELVFKARLPTDRAVVAIPSADLHSEKLRRSCVTSRSSCFPKKIGELHKGGPCRARRGYGAGVAIQASDWFNCTAQAPRKRTSGLALLLPQPQLNSNARIYLARSSHLTRTKHDFYITAVIPPSSPLTNIILS